MQSDVIKRNTGLSNLQRDVFVFRSPAVKVSVFNDRNKDGQKQSTEPFQSGATVTITDSAGETVGTGLTSTGGSVCAATATPLPPSLPSLLSLVNFPVLQRA